MTAWTAPSTQTTGFLVGTTQYNDHIINNLLHLHEAVNSIVLLQDQKASGTDGGTFTAGAWQTRDLNTEVVDVNGVCTLSSNQFTLAVGTYEIIAMAPGHNAGDHQARLQNTTAATTILLGQLSGGATGGNTTTISMVTGRFTVAASQALELQHRCTNTAATLGFGAAGSFGTEVYSQVFLRRVSQ